VVLLNGWFPVVVEWTRISVIFDGHLKKMELNVCSSLPEAAWLISKPITIMRKL